MLHFHFVKYTQFMYTKIVRLMHYHVFFLSSIQATLAASLPNKKEEIAFIQLLHYSSTTAASLPNKKAELIVPWLK